MLELHRTAPPVGFFSVLDAFAHWVRETPENLAATHGSSSLSYAELDQLSDQLAERMVAGGTGRGDAVGLFLERSLSMVVGILGILKCGAAYVPLDARIAPHSHQAHAAKKTGMRTVVTTSRFLGTLGVDESLDVIDLEPMMNDECAHLPHAAREVRASQICADDACVIVFTSGTTGSPNGVVVTHANLANVLFEAPSDLGMRPGLVVAQILNIAFDMAVWETLGALTHGATLAIRGADIAETVRAADIVIATPSILAGLDPLACAPLVTVAVAGEHCSRAIADDWAGIARFFNACGPTEVTIVNTMHEHLPDGEAPAIGVPLPNTTVYLLDEHGHPAAPGEAGEMWVGGAGVTAGYVGEPELTRARFLPDPFARDGSRMFGTRDLARWDEHGRLHHLGRIDDQVKVRGFRVELQAVGAALEREPSVTAAAVVLGPDGSSLLGYVSPAQADTTAAVAEVRKLLPYYCVPTAVHAVERLPVTARGKVDRRKLSERATEAASTVVSDAQAARSVA